MDIRADRLTILRRAEAIERSTKLPGMHGGVFQHTGLKVLRTILFNFMNADTGLAWPSYESIAAAAQVARSTVGRAIKALVDHNILNKEKRARCENGRIIRETNVYSLPPLPAQGASPRSPRRSQPKPKPKPEPDRPSLGRKPSLQDILSSVWTPAEQEAARQALAARVASFVWRRELHAGVRR
jgi:hypothetical protein